MIDPRPRCPEARAAWRADNTPARPAPAGAHAAPDRAQRVLFSDVAPRRTGCNRIGVPVGPINPASAHLGAYACPPCVRVDPLRAPPGDVPFSDFLDAIHAIDQIASDRWALDKQRTDRAELSDAARSASHTERPDTWPEPARDEHAARIGEVLPVRERPTPEAPAAQPPIRVMNPLGVMIDLTV